MKYSIGIDVGDKINFVCVLDSKGKIVEEVSIENSPKAMREYFSKYPKSEVALEAGSHSIWISFLLLELGLKPIVCNPRKLSYVTSNLKKSDPEDARNLAQLLLSGRHLLSPVIHRSLELHKDFLMIKSRRTLVRCRTKTINTVRGMIKSFGERIPGDIDADNFHKEAGKHISKEILNNIKCLIDSTGQMTKGIKDYDKKINKLIKSKYPSVENLMTIPSIGPITALTYFLVIGNPERFKNSRAAGTYVGLVPRRDQSGDSDKQLQITKAGNSYLRHLLMNCANHLLGPFGEDNQLRRFGLRIKGTGESKIQKRKACVAVARKFCVIMHSMMLSGEPFMSKVDSKITIKER